MSSPTTEKAKNSGLASAAKDVATKAAPGVTPMSALTPNFTAKDYSIFFAAGALCCTM
jgi:hypothetical protein